ncbi:MAG: type II toxin-antitoxin system VapC family toxin [Candidatus Dormibacteraceae bacterium]
MIVDASALYAQANADDSRHEQVVASLLADPGPLVTTQLALAEADYLIERRLGIQAEIAFLRDLAEGTFIAECLDRAGLQQALDLVTKYRELGLGLSDASLIVLANRRHTKRILTLDERHFRIVTPLEGGAFSVLPADSED